jgi:hypothetical protein
MPRPVVAFSAGAGAPAREPFTEGAPAVAFAADPGAPASEPFTEVAPAVTLLEAGPAAGPPAVPLTAAEGLMAVPLMAVPLVAVPLVAAEGLVTPETRMRMLRYRVPALNPGPLSTESDSPKLCD